MWKARPSADRLLMLATIAAWLVICGLAAATMPLSHPPAEANLPLVAFAIIFVGIVAAMVAVLVVAIPLRVIQNMVLKDRRRSHRSETMILGSVLLLTVVYPLEVRRERNRLTPPPGVKTLVEFAKVTPPPRLLEQVKHGNNDYYVWFGQTSGPLDLPSGPSCYLFDNEGNLIDWQAETGDGGRVESFLHSCSRGEEVSIGAALDLIREFRRRSGE